MWNSPSSAFFASFSSCWDWDSFFSQTFEPWTYKRLSPLACSPPPWQFLHPLFGWPRLFWNWASFCENRFRNIILEPNRFYLFAVAAPQVDNFMAQEISQAFSALVLASPRRQVPSNPAANWRTARRSIPWIPGFQPRRIRRWCAYWSKSVIGCSHHRTRMVDIDNVNLTGAAMLALLGIKGFCRSEVTAEPMAEDGGPPFFGLAWNQGLQSGPTA